VRGASLSAGIVNLSDLMANTTCISAKLSLQRATHRFVATLFLFVCLHLNIPVLTVSLSLFNFELVNRFKQLPVCLIKNVRDHLQLIKRIV
jgi:hypothetical protein